MRGDLTGIKSRIPHAIREVKDSPLAKGGWALELMPHDGPAVMAPTGADLAEAHKLAEQYVNENFAGRTL